MRPLKARRAALVIALLVGVRLAASPDAPPAAAAWAMRLQPIADVVQEQIALQRIPGAVVEIGRGDAVIYRRAFGARTTAPVPDPMTADTAFDLASVTKVVATTTAVLQLADRGAIRLDAPASTYWPRFGTRGKDAITIRNLLTHYSGLRPDLDLQERWSGYRAAIQRLADERPVAAPGTRYVYSDENFAVLGEIVRRVSGLPLDTYAERRIFAPLRMTHTRFRPARALGGVAVAPTAGRQPAASTVIPVNDPMAARMGGVAGHAGLFSTADDLGRFARMWLRGGELDGVRVLRQATVAAATVVQSPAGVSRPRGLGWDVAHAAASGLELPAGSYGHTGYTGTLIWIDPASEVYVIILTNRTYPDGRGDAQPLRDAILRLVFGADRARSVTAASD